MFFSERLCVFCYFGEEGPRPGERFYDFVVYVRAFLVVRGVYQGVFSSSWCIILYGGVVYITYQGRFLQ